MITLKFNVSYQDFVVETRGLMTAQGVVLKPYQTELEGLPPQMTFVFITFTLNKLPTSSV